MLDFSNIEWCIAVLFNGKITNGDFDETEFENDGIPYKHSKKKA